LQKIIKKFGSQVLRRLRNYGLDVQRVQDIDMQIGKLRSIKDLNTRLRSLEQLVSMHPKHPKAHLELVECLHTICDPKEFEQMNRYAIILKDWLLHSGLEELKMEFIWVGMVIGSFGNHYAIEGLLRANKYGLRAPKKIFLLLPENANLRNPALFSYFEPHLHVIREREIIQAMKGLESTLTLNLGIGLPMNDICPFLDIAANMVEVERVKKGMEKPLFHVNDKHNEMGQQALKKLGLPDNAWYVTIHVRETGFRGETKKNTTENWRNANPLDYIKAIKAVTKAGGWVFRMGDPSMTPLPKMSQVIDYAHNAIRCDWMDVFLGATCRFLIGTASGFLRVPGYFGVPVIFTNCTHFVPYYSLKQHDLYLPRLLIHNESGEQVSLNEYMSPPISMIHSAKRFTEARIDFVTNNPEELEAVTIEMLERTIEGQSSILPDDDLQQRFKSMAEKCGKKYGGHSVKAFAPVSRDFLQKQAKLLGQ
jgi:putative glycosyltransferase (TIGR04372 family)